MSTARAREFLACKQTMSVAAPTEFKVCEYGACGHNTCDAIRQMRVHGRARDWEQAFMTLFSAAQHHCNYCESKHKGDLMESLESLAKRRAELRAREGVN